MRTFQVECWAPNRAFGLSIPAASIMECLDTLKKFLVGLGFTNEHLSVDINDVTPD
jgi:hypothetical protein